STIGGMMDCFGTAISMSLQYGVPLEVYVTKFSHTRFEPMGHTKNPDVRFAKSIIDYIFRWLAVTFLPGYREANNGAAAKPPEAEPGESETELGPTATKDGGPNAGQGAATNQVAPSSNGHSVTSADAPIQVKPPAGRSSVATQATIDVMRGRVVAGVLDISPTTPAGQSEQFANFQTDAPACDSCGCITVRNGNCYLCHNCGNSMGCS
ncbi:MAG: vitamin B12-dependent ribonucleotide reductase, partial [Pirellulales bacterium]|nr:vitamin B12-dependent ribonucleotide reductase [Pirellulales bacterium]